MSSEAIIRILREGLLMVCLLSAPAVLVAMLLGFIISVFQATTQIQEQTISSVPKLVAVFAVLAIAGPWMLAQIVRFAGIMLATIPNVR